VTESIGRFRALPADQRARIHFTHLNHTNPAADPASPAAAAVRAAGMHVAREGLRVDL
jgi:pyrroloquinoline quinone biosynthesis protein B